MAGLTAAELATILRRLEAFADDLFASLPRADQRARGECYLRGLLLEGGASRSELRKRLAGRMRLLRTQITSDRGAVFRWRQLHCLN